MTESHILAACLQSLGTRPDWFVWRNNTGTALAAYPPHRPITFGLPGSADILGVRAVTITPAHVGLTIGQAAAIECKRPATHNHRAGHQSEQQARFQVAWEQRGGLYVLARSPDDIPTDSNP